MKPGFDTSFTMLHFVDKIMTAFTVNVRFTMTVVALVLLFAGAGIMTADDGIGSPTRPVNRNEPINSDDEPEKPPLFSGNGKFLASLRFWEKNKTKPQSEPAAARQPKPQTVPAEQPESSSPSASRETSSAPEPPPNPYLSVDANTGNAPLPGLSQPTPQESGNAGFPQENRIVNPSHVSYSFDSRDWVDTFAVQYEQEAALEESSDVVQKTANRSPVVASPSYPQAENDNNEWSNEWNGHATALDPHHSTATPVSYVAPVGRPPVDLTASYEERLEYVQRCGAVVVQANFPLTEIASILDEINLLQHDLTRYIGVPEPKEKIELCLFKDQESYIRFLREFFPRAPLDRRALFVKLDNKPGTLMVQKTQNFEIDLRHEMTHAIIHASIPTVPIWLDEGLAKYFEVPAQDRLNNNPYMSRIRWNVRLGVVPSLDRLVKLETIDDMGSKEYQDSWAWAHFMIHRSPDTHHLLAAYLQMLSKWSPQQESKSNSASGLSAAGQKVRTFIAQEFLGRNSQGSIPSLKLYLDEMMPKQREMFKEHFAASEK